MKVSIIYAFGRSGSTLLNRCLGCIPGNIVLSEVNPCGDVMPIAIQASKWFNLIDFWEVEAFSKKNYQEKIELLVERASQRGEHLIIRDWTTINFLWNASNEFHVPSCQLEQSIYLAFSKLEVKSIVFSRKSVDVYSSFIQTFEYLSHFTPQEFSQQYLRYSTETCGFPVFHYEDFCENPHKVLMTICKELDVNYCPSFVEDFCQYGLCTGDNLLKNPSRGSQLKEIKPLQNSEDPTKDIYLTPDFAQADYLFGYGGSSNYADELDLPEKHGYQQRLLSILLARDLERAKLRTKIYSANYADPHLTESLELESQSEGETEPLVEDDYSVVVNLPEKKTALIDECQELEEKYQQLRAEHDIIKNELLASSSLIGECQELEEKYQQLQTEHDIIKNEFLASSSIKGAFANLAKRCLRIGLRQPSELER